jgi:hypothetical protein
LQSDFSFAVFYGIFWLKVARGHMDVFICRDVACNVPTYENIHDYGAGNIRYLIIKLSFADDLVKVRALQVLYITRTG